MFVCEVLAITGRNDLFRGIVALPSAKSRPAHPERRRREAGCGRAARDRSPQLPETLNLFAAAHQLDPFPLIVLV